MKEYKYKINGNEYSVAIIDLEGNTAAVEVNGVSYKVDILTEGFTAAPARPAAKPAAPAAPAAGGGAGRGAKAPADAERLRARDEGGGGARARDGDRREPAHGDVRGLFPHRAGRDGVGGLRLVRCARSARHGGLR